MKRRGMAENRYPRQHEAHQNIGRNICSGQYYNGYMRKRLDVYKALKRAKIEICESFGNKMRDNFNEN